MYGSSSDADEITVTGDNAYIRSGAGNDIIDVFGDNATINAGEGDDTIRLSESASSSLNLINGGVGDDLLIYRGSSSHSRALNDVLSRLSFVNDGVNQYVTVDGNNQLQSIERIQFQLGAENIEVRIVGQDCYATIAAATAQDDISQGTIIYVANTNVITNDTINHAGLNIYFAQSSHVANLNLADDVNSVDLYGQRNFILTGTSEADVIRDHTVAATGVNTINGLGGNDILISDSNAASITVLNGGEGNDVLSGGVRDQLFGGNGSDTLLAAFGNAYLSGGSGNDLLINAYLGAASDLAVTMLGGSGVDNFVIMGNDAHSLPGVSNTLIGDLATGDRIDLSFLEKSGDIGLTSTADLVGKASLSSAGAAFNLKGFSLSSSEGANDVDHLLDDGSRLVVANSTLSKASTAINAGFAANTIDLSAQFGNLTDVYQHVG
jgi:Ca2+-binding RTX toxin-like protein